jgi:serine/threonine protein kinase/dienelactone hydrolase
VRALLRGYENNSAYLEHPAGGGDRGEALPFEANLPAEPGEGDIIGPYRLGEHIGEGGFGVVYRAEQTEPLRRRVALKLIRLGLNTREFIARFAVERQALALMEHPNIARVLDAGATEAGRPYLVMEFIAGVPITRDADARRLSWRERLELFLQVCGAIQHAHQKGIVHRDLKPSNVLVTRGDDGAAVPKLIDFGIAKAIRGPLTKHVHVTQQHALIGTPAYTSPEQIDSLGGDTDPRSDIYSLGALLYELLAGTPPFDRRALRQLGLEGMRRTIREVDPLRPSVRVEAYADAERARIAARRGVEPAKFAALLRTDLDWIVMKCLEKDPARRYATADGLAADLRCYLASKPVAARPPSGTYRAGKFFRRHRVGLLTGAVAAGVAVAGGLGIALQTRRALKAERVQNDLRQSAQRAELAAVAAQRAAENQAERVDRIRWAREEALPEVARLARRNETPAAFALALRAEEFIPNDPALAALWPQISAAVSVETTPAGADIYVQPYNQPDAAWQYLGKSPLTNLRLPRDYHRWRIEKKGYTTVERADGWWWVWNGRRLVCPLFSPAETPPGMVRVLGEEGLRLQNVQLEDYWIDRHEVTNREFKAFVDGGGYENGKWWKNDFVRAGVKLDWSEGMALFLDRTGKRGPAGWANRTYPEGEDDLPVTGVSWFEAAAYAEFVGKRLPSVAHWRKAGNPVESEYLTPRSNFGTRGLAPVGASAALNWCGAVDLAGNVKEWCWNETRDGQRFLLGGGWGEPDYMFVDADAASPFDREAKYGFRCIRLDPGKTIPAEVMAPMPMPVPRDYAAERPVSEEQFNSYQRFYAYDAVALEARVEGAVTETVLWKQERVSFRTANGGERMEALIYLPRQGRPPWQTVVYLPGAGARYQVSSEAPRDMPVVEALLGTGRAVAYPIVAGTYERRLANDTDTGEIGSRDRSIQVVKDVRRTIDYLETREDLQRGRLALAGISWGTLFMPAVSALEHRVKVNVVIAGGLTGGSKFREVDPFTFVPHVTVPTLMINGRQDFFRPLESSQLPFLRALGTPAEQKKHLRIDGGHGFPINQVVPDIRDWLDRWLGPVEK